MKIPRAGYAFVSIVSVCSIVDAQVTDRWTIHKLPALDSTQNYYGAQLNNVGTIVGAGGTSPIVWRAAADGQSYTADKVLFDVADDPDQGALELVGGCTSVNERGQVVGSCTYNNHSAFLYDSTGEDTVGGLFFPYEWWDPDEQKVKIHYRYAGARDINDLGYIAGFLVDADGGENQAVRICSSDALAETVARQGEAVRVNNPGDVLGYTVVPARVFVWHCRTRRISYIAEEAGSTVQPAAINDHGEALVNIDGKMYLWHEGDLTEVGDGFGRDMNNAGIIVGGSNDSLFGINHARVWVPQAEGDYHGYTLPDFGGSSAACAINEKGQITGTAYDPSSERCVGVVWEAVEMIEPSLHLSWPDGSRAFAAASVQTITWKSQGYVGDVLLEYSTDGGSSWLTIAEDVVNNWSYDWHLPDADSDQCLVRISSADNPEVNDCSDASFAIFMCRANLTSDVNGDCYVDLIDVALLAAEWLKCGNPFDAACGVSVP